MRILCIDIGTGTQDIILFDTRLEIENSYKLIVPSPTMIIHQRIQAATRAGRAVVLTGTLMGGGPSAWAAGEHIRCGLKVYATPQAARSFNDDLEVVRDSGVMLVSEDEALKLAAEVERIELKDFDHQAVADAFAAFGVSLHGLDAAVLAVFDHGNAPVDEYIFLSTGGYSASHDPPSGSGSLCAGIGMPTGGDGYRPGGGVGGAVGPQGMHP
jgi:uncharacterized protein (DUF1786 family)